jgi:hypothetical protein
LEEETRRSQTLKRAGVEEVRGARVVKEILLHDLILQIRNYILRTRRPYHARPDVLSFIRKGFQSIHYCRGEYEAEYCREISKPV